MSTVVEEVAANLYRIILPIPVPLLDSINIYVICGSSRSLIVDAGPYDEGCMAAFMKALTSLGVNLQESDFFITHGHPDHFGLLGMLTTDQSVVYINADEIKHIRRARSAGIMTDYAHFLSTTGFPELDPYKVFPHDTLEPYQVEKGWDFQFVKEGDVLEYGGYSFGCVATPGHTGGHMCLYDEYEGLLLAGDHLLLDISPTIQLWSETDNPLMSYFQSLHKVSKMVVNLTLPGHGPVFGNCRKRIEQLIRHHEERLSEIISVLTGGTPKDAYEIASNLTWNLSGCVDWDSTPIIQKFFATGESFSHLKYLEEQDKVCRKMEGQRIMYSRKVGEFA